MCLLSRELNLANVQQVLADLPLRTFLQAALLTASEGGWTVRELAEQLGMPKSTLHDWISRARRTNVKIPRVEVTDPAAGAAECNHRRLYSDKRHRVCLRCLLSNFERAPLLTRNPNFDPTPEPKARLKYQPGKLKGGRA